MLLVMLLWLSLLGVAAPVVVVALELPLVSLLTSPSFALLLSLLLLLLF